MELTYKIEYIPFYKRLLKHSLPFAFSYFIAFITVVIYYHAFIIALVIALTLYALTSCSLYGWNVYFIKDIEIKDNIFYIKAYKYNNIFLDINSSLDNVTVDVKVASTSIRGKSYKMLLTIKNTQITQYPIHGWDKQKFDSILSRVAQKNSKHKHT